jgi:AraC family transcriptional regulator of adaptative response/methylated-DNA-[protein]-cysteine methyltransferase
MKKTLTSTEFETILGPMLAIADEQALYLLEFLDGKKLAQKRKQLHLRTGFSISPGIAPPLQSIQKELASYFEGTLRAFTTPVCLNGTVFQQRAWKALQAIPYGETRAYADMANQIGQPTAFRAVANANGANLLPIIIPCHRVIQMDGRLGGFSSGIHRKEWLLAHEATYS